MWLIKIKNWSLGHDTRWVDHQVAFIIVPLDVIKEYGLLDAGDLIKLARIGPKIRVILQHFQIAFEMPVIDRIETDQGGE